MGSARRSDDSGDQTGHNPYGRETKTSLVHYGLIAGLALSAAVIVPVVYWGYKVEAANDSGQDGLPIAVWVTLAAGMILLVVGWYWLLRKLVHGKDKKDR